MTQNQTTAALSPAGIFSPMQQRDFVRGIYSVLLGLGFIALLISFLALLAPQELHAEETTTQQANADELQAGLYFNAGLQDLAFRAPELNAEVKIAVFGLVQRVTVRQHFKNPTKAWLEGLYVFPLPEKSAVDRLTMIVGERIIKGKILEKAEAKRSYEKAKAEGRKASLLAAERGNVFTTSIANIAPGEEVIIEIEYQDAVRYQDSRFELRFPMVVAPRYTPPASLNIAEDTNSPTPTPTPAKALALGGDEARDLFGPIRHPTEGKANPLTLAIDLDAGLPLENLKSLYHDVTIETLENNRQRILLADGQVAADRDFVLEWRAKSGDQPEAMVFAEEVGGESHLLVSLFPPTTDDQRERTASPRDLIFIIDTSGSMYGPSIEQAKTALLTALTRLNPEDRFNIIRFNDQPYRLFDQARRASVENVEEAWHYVKALEADGGTEMESALTMAMKEQPVSGRIMQMVFLTDGAVGNEDQLLRHITRHLGERRLFTIGIGSAPNSYFMREAAEFGRGTFTYIGAVDEVGERMEALFQKLENPALTDLSLSLAGLEDLEAETYPSRLPDLYAGEPVTFAMRLRETALEALEGEIILEGKEGGAPWQRTLSLEDVQPAPGVASIWAREKIEEIEAGLPTAHDPAAVKARALKVALTHKLVTRYTSLVAIDVKPARPASEALTSGEIERNLPAGWDWNHVFGEMRQTMELTPLPQSLMHKISGDAITLPKGATGAPFMIGLGTLSLLGAIFLFWLSYRNRAPAQSVA